MGIDTFFGVIFFVVIYFCVVAFVGFLAIVKSYWLVIVLGALLYIIFRKSINSFFRKIWKKKVYSILTIIVTIFIVLILFISSIGAAMNSSSEKAYSPNGAYFAQVDENNCGATCSFMTGVTVSDAHSILSNFSLLRYRAGASKSVFWFNGSLSSATPSWVDNHTLKITYGNCTKLYGEKTSKWRDIAIVYEGNCSPN
jgi:energy-coupling factor transporter transmembrane protein EcfT